MGVSLPGSHPNVAEPSPRSRSGMYILAWKLLPVMEPLPLNCLSVKATVADLLVSIKECCVATLQILMLLILLTPSPVRLRLTLAEERTRLTVCCFVPVSGLTYQLLTGSRGFELFVVGVKGLGMVTLPPMGMVWLS